MAPPNANLAETRSPTVLGWAQLKLKVQQQKACRAFELFRAAGIEPVLIKGLAAARHYPDDVVRESIDIDLAVESADFERSVALVKSPDFDGLAIDLHRELRHLDTAEWSVLFGRSELVETPFGNLRMLAPEDHLRVMCVHWLNDGGASRDRLWDIYYAVANRADDFDWGLFLDNVSPTRRRWLACTLGLAHRYLGLPLDSLPIEPEARDLPAWLIKSVENSWAHPRKEIPLWVTVRRPGLLIEQIASRFIVNPVRATVELEGSFDGDFRLRYQFINFLQRLAPSVSRNVRSFSK